MNCTSLEHPCGFPSSGASTFGTGDRTIGAAVVISLLIHAIGLGWLPGLREPLAKVSQSLQIRLAAPVVRPEPVAVPAARAFAPAPSASRRDHDLPRHETLPVLTQSVRQAPQDAPSVQAYEPLPARSDEAPRASPAPSAAPSTRLDPEVLAGYGRELAGAVARHQRYPRLALLRQWQGSAVLRLEFGADSRLLTVRVLSSSGYEILDRQALEMVREATPLPQLPAALAGQTLSVDVPVVFRITS